jgi:hypothetical protein
MLELHVLVGKLRWHKPVIFKKDVINYSVL